MTALCDALYWMVQGRGGIHSGREEGRKPVKYKKESLPRKMDGSIFAAAQTLKKSLAGAFASKNQKTTKTENVRRTSKN